ncbi:hypothetical protein [Rhizohabitans arisaemae]|uniref:hypothetical protein n=1 Tax=Rhizohabitans arisaemae TaxID=2720610 RepID=UPI0024B189CC|nr:hypothetical protein [Rhizohabitans arisaemae]
MKQGLRLNRRERLIAILATVLALTIGTVTGIAFAGPGEGHNPNPPKSCNDQLPEGTPSFVHCWWLAQTPQDALDVYKYWTDERVESAKPYPMPHVFCSGLSYDPFTQNEADRNNPNVKGPKCKNETACKKGVDTSKYWCYNAEGKRVNPPSGVDCSNYDCSVTNTSDGSTSSSGSDPPATGTDTGTDTVGDAGSGDTPSEPEVPGFPERSMDPTTPATPPTEPAATEEPPGGNDAPVAPKKEVAPSAGPVSEAVSNATKLGMSVWLEADLTQAYLAGGDLYKNAVTRLARNAQLEGVVGIQFAWDLGYQGNLKDAKAIERFVKLTAAEVRKIAPTKRLAVNILVPEFGCGTNASCVTAVRAKYPALALPNVERYVLTGAVDTVQLSSGIYLQEYRAANISPSDAQKNLWISVKARGWDTRVHLGARDVAFGHKNNSPWDAPRAEAETSMRVDLPIKYGAQTVALWSHRQDWDGLWRIFNPNLAHNAATSALAKRKGLNRTAVQFDPAQVERNVADDLKAISGIASHVYIFAG